MQTIHLWHRPLLSTCSLWKMWVAKKIIIHILCWSPNWFFFLPLVICVCILQKNPNFRLCSEPENIAGCKHYSLWKGWNDRTERSNPVHVNTATLHMYQLNVLGNYLLVHLDFINHIKLDSIYVLDNPALIFFSLKNLVN